MTALVFPSDPLCAYVQKGEIKRRYFNPENLFDEIHFVTFGDQEIDSAQIQAALGNARGFAHRLPPLSLADQLFPIKRLNTIKKVLNGIVFHAVRGYSPAHTGFFATCIAQERNIPCLLSLHSNFDDLRQEYWMRGEYLRFLKYLWSKLFIEHSVLKKATALQAAYRYTATYALNNGADPQKIRLVYNRVYFDQFFPAPFAEEGPIKIIAVGHLEEGKGQRTLLEAFAKLRGNPSLTLVGDGPDALLLKARTEELGLADRVTFIPRVPNADLAALYREHHIFALPIRYGGICIPALEATASGLAVVYPIPKEGGLPEVTGEYARVVENSIEGFRQGIQELIDNPQKRLQIRKAGLKIIQNYSGDAMEAKEADLYKALLKSSFNKQI